MSTLKQKKLAGYTINKIKSLEDQYNLLFHILQKLIQHIAILEDNCKFLAQDQCKKCPKHCLDEINVATKSKRGPKSNKWNTKNRVCEIFAAKKYSSSIEESFSDDEI